MNGIPRAFPLLVMKNKRNITPLFLLISYLVAGPAWSEAHIPPEEPVPAVEVEAVAQPEVESKLVQETPKSSVGPAYRHTVRIGRAINAGLR